MNNYYQSCNFIPVINYNKIKGNVKVPQISYTKIMYSTANLLVLFLSENQKLSTDISQHKNYLMRKMFSSYSMCWCCYRGHCIAWRSTGVVTGSLIQLSLPLQALSRIGRGMQDCTGLTSRRRDEHVMHSLQHTNKHTHITG